MALDESTILVALDEISLKKDRDFIDIFSKNATGFTGGQNL